MKNVKNKIKIKAGALLIVWLLIAVSVGVVFGGVVTNTDVSTTTTDTDMEINYQNGTITFLEQFMVNGTTKRFINDSNDNLATLIHNGNGSYYPATETGFQDAIDNSTSGDTVWTPNVNMTVTTSIYGKTGVSLIGDGTTLFLGDGANVKLLYLHGVTNMTVEGFTFRMNNDSNTYGATLNAISLAEYSENITIRKCYFYNGLSSFIDCQETTRYIIIEYCHFDNIEINAGAYPGAIWFAGEHCKALYNYIEDTYGSGIVMEANTSSPSSKNHLIDGNTITGRIGFGIAMEGYGSQNYVKASNCTIVNNDISDLDSPAYFDVGNPETTGNGTGIGITENSTCSNNKIRNVDMYGIIIIGNNTDLSNNIINGVTKFYGIRASTKATKVTISGGSVMNTNDDGINIAGNCHIAIIIGVLLENIGQSGIVSTADRTSISTCTFTNIGNIGVEIGTGANNVTITGGNEFDGIVGAAIYIIPGAEGVITSNFIYNANYGIDTFGSWFTISLNEITSCTLDGIKLHNSKNHTLIGNIIKECSDGIEMDDSFNNTLIGNRIHGCNYGIIETGTSEGSILLGNIVTDSITADIDINLAGTTIYGFNKGAIS